MDTLLEVIEHINYQVNSIVWGPVMIMFFLLVGLGFTVFSNFFQLSKFKLWTQKTIGTFFIRDKTNSNQRGISSFQAMTTALAGAIGTGNIVGVATAISLGGPGSIFWMWLAAILGMMTICAENILGVKYRKTNSKGEYVGGPMYYIEYGLGQKWLAIIFSIFCIFSTIGMGNMTQANSIACSLESSFSFQPRYTAIILSIITALIIFGGINRIAKITECIVPFMALFYILGGFIVIFVNIRRLPDVLASIFVNAFNLKSATGGAVGITVAKAIKYGISRGIFSNEAGLGSAPIIYSASNETEPVVQGMWGIFQVFIDTIIACTTTALCILCSGTAWEGIDGIELSNKAFESVFGSMGGVFVTISITLFAFATIIGWSFYGEKSLEYIAGEKYIPIFKAFYIVAILFGCVMDLNLVWNIADTFNGLMAIPNLVAITLLSREVISEIRKYNRQNRYPLI